MSTKMKVKDPVLRGSFAALKRAARRAKRLAVATGTPLYIMRDGKVVNVNPTNGRASPKMKRAL